MERTKAAEILEKAADLYESETIGWCTGSNFQAGEVKLSACAQGAIFLASGVYNIGQEYLTYGGQAALYPWEVKLGYVPVPSTLDGNHFEDLENKASVVIAMLAKSLKAASVPRFNDGPDRTKQEVIDAMKECAKELRNAA